MRSPWKDTESQIQQILTSEQQNQLQTAIQSGQKPREAFRSLNLSEAQKSQIQQLHRLSWQKMKAVLTPDQQQQLQAQMQQMRQERQQRQNQ